MDQSPSRLWKCYKTVHEMVGDRGYMVSSSELDMSLAEFTAQYAKTGTVDRPSLTFLVEHTNSAEDQLLVFFAEEETVGIKPIRRICERMISQVQLLFSA